MQSLVLQPKIASENFGGQRFRMTISQCGVIPEFYLDPCHPVWFCIFTMQHTVKDKPCRTEQHMEGFDIGSCRLMGEFNWLGGKNIPCIPVFLQQGFWGSEFFEPWCKLADKPVFPPLLSSIVVIKDVVNGKCCTVEVNSSGKMKDLSLWLPTSLCRYICLTDLFHCVLHGSHWEKPTISKRRRNVIICRQSVNLRCLS